VVVPISTRIAVRVLGCLVELGPALEVCHHPRHPYSQVLLAAMPLPDREPSLRGGAAAAARVAKRGSPHRIDVQAIRSMEPGSAWRCQVPQSRPLVPLTGRHTRCSAGVNEHTLSKENDMKRMSAAALGLVALFAFAHSASSETWGRTGDGRLDSTLGKLTSEAQGDPDGFITELSSRFNIPTPEIRQARVSFGFGGADLFMATALASLTRRPVLTVAEQYSKNQGKGWGVMAKEMGIKPGSKAFHAMKRHAREMQTHMRSAATSRQRHMQEMQKADERRLDRHSRGNRSGRSQ